MSVNAFNNEQYKEAIEYCEKFFDAERNLKEKSTLLTNGFSLKQLEAQEQVILHYHIQLIYAHSYFECAKAAKKGSKERETYMKKAEEICIDFEHSSKSLFYIGEQFDMLKNFIDSENGKISNDENKTTYIENDIE